VPIEQRLLLPTREQDTSGHMKKGPKDRDFEKMASQLDHLRKLSAEAVLKQWQALFDVARPEKLRSSLIVQGGDSPI
jgi:hypothetical protein